MKLRIVSLVCIAILLSFLTACLPPESTDTGWIVGYWVMDSSYWPGTSVVNFNSNKMVNSYYDYACTILVGSMPYQFDGATLIVIPYAYTIQKISNDSFIMTGGSSSFIIYRKGTEPGGNLLNNPSEIPALNTWYSDSITAGEIVAYYFTATQGNSYYVKWDENGYSGTYNGDITMHACNNLGEIYFRDRIDGYSDPHLIADVTTSTVYLIVKGVANGTFGIWIEETTNPFAGAININVDGGWVTGSVATSGKVIYSFDAMPNIVYNVYWDDSVQGSGTFTGDILVSAYDADEASKFIAQDSGYIMPGAVYPINSSKIYIVVEGVTGGNYRIQVD